MRSTPGIASSLANPIPQSTMIHLRPFSGPKP